MDALEQLGEPYAHSSDLTRRVVAHLMKQGYTFALQQIDPGKWLAVGCTPEGSPHHAYGSTGGIALSSLAILLHDVHGRAVLPEST